MLEKRWRAGCLLRGGSWRVFFSSLLLPKYKYIFAGLLNKHYFYYLSIVSVGAPLKSSQVLFKPGEGLGGGGLEGGGQQGVNEGLPVRELPIAQLVIYGEPIDHLLGCKE